MATVSPDFLVIGAGVAGLRAAISLATAGRVLVVAKDSLQESNSQYAQGGIAAALADDDDVAIHYEDTLAAGDGLCDEAAVRVLVDEGPRAIEELIAWGAHFDYENGRLAFAREGAHSRSRVLHARGDSTGQEIVRTLYFHAASLKNVSFLSTSMVVEACGGGALLQDGTTLTARATLLATGGAGCLFRYTTNPPVATGDGVAMAIRAGARVADLEFYQFHPTALAIPGKPSFLLSEALRGEGAVLRNVTGDRFTDELAPRDVVARAIAAEMKRTGAPVLLDLTGKDAAWIGHRFPRIYKTCAAFGIDLATTAAPVSPAAHYWMGGVRTDLDGRTSLPSLYAAGEVACTGVHGANRLASNSLLEGLVYGARAAQAMMADAVYDAGGSGPSAFSLPTRMVTGDVSGAMWEHCGLSRNAAGLRQLRDHLAQMPEVPAAPSRENLERRNLHLLATKMAEAAEARTESRGAHYRDDAPVTGIMNAGNE